MTKCLLQTFYKSEAEVKYFFAYILVVYIWRTFKSRAVKYSCGANNKDSLYCLRYVAS